MMALTLQEQFGQIDIYLFDQLLKGRITPGMRIVDAGCGSGRNIVYFLREGYEVYAADADAEAVDGVQALARRFAPGLPESNFRVEPVERMSFEDAWADVAISNTVLHFARDDVHFEAMLMGTWRVLRPGGLFFCRLGSTIGMESRVERVQGRRYRSPDGSERYLVDEELVGRFTGRLGGEMADPLKTTIVQNQRAMTTWVLRKGPAAATQAPFGAMRGEFELPEEWDRPFTADEADAFCEGK
jgi:SAM-dependent methyltransferase